MGRGDAVSLPAPCKDNRVGKLTIVPEWSTRSYYLVKDAAGKTVAQGSYELCALVAARLPIFSGPGDLFVDRPPPMRYVVREAFEGK